MRVSFPPDHVCFGAAASQVEGRTDAFEERLVSKLKPSLMLHHSRIGKGSKWITQNQFRVEAHISVSAGPVAARLTVTGIA